MKRILKKLDVVGLFLIVGVMVVYSIRGVWTVYQTSLLIVGVSSVVVSMASKFNEIRAKLSSKSTGFQVNSVVSILLLVGVLGFINYLGVEYEQRFDLTTEKSYSLADQSRSVLGQIKRDVQILAFYPRGDDLATRELLELYVSSNSLITFEFVDPDRQPQLAQQFDVSVYGEVNNPMTGQNFRSGTIILEMEGRRERIEKQSNTVREEDITNSLMKLVKNVRKVIYFIEGHDEKLITGTDRAGLDLARGALERENYIVKPLNLAREETIPTDAAVLIWASPQVDPFPGEIRTVNAFLQEGGSVFLMLDPVPSRSLDNLLDYWSILAGDNFVVDASGVGRLLGAGPEIPMVSDYPPHPITSRFNVMTFFPLARSITPLEEVKAGLNVTELLKTGEQSWGESDTTSTKAGFDPESDVEGPVTIGVVVTGDLDDEEESRLVVFGDSDFASNAFFSLQGNGNLFLNTVNWLAEDEDFISIRPRAPEDRRITLTESQGRLTHYLSLVLLPLCILTAGISVWMNRRER